MTHIRILHRDTAGKVFDGGVDFGPEDFAGQVPAIGDMILNPGVPVGKKRGGPGCLNRLAVWISGSPLVDHAAARSGWSKYTWSGVLVPRAECGRMLL